MPEQSNPFLVQLYRRAFASRDAEQVQVTFDASVLERYRSGEGYSLARTDTVGRIKREGGWTIDVGIAEGEALIHASLRDLMYSLPEPEREHWARHVVTPPFSQVFLQMRLAPGSCFDDGELRAWE